LTAYRILSTPYPTVQWFNGVTEEGRTYDREVVGSTSGWVAIKQLGLPIKRVSVCGQVNYPSIDL